MKKVILALIAIALVVSSARADGGFRAGGSVHYQASGSLSAGEFFCAIAGGFAGGAIVKEAGANSPFTFLGALIGGIIGVNFCKYLNDPVAQGLQEAARKGLSDERCGETRWRGSDYHGTLQVLAQGYSKEGLREGQTQNICKYFETTIYENDGRGKRVARTKAWACLDERGDWIIKDERWVIRENVRSCSGERIDGGGTINIIEPDVVVTPVKNPRWDIRVFLGRTIQDRGVTRNLKLAKRVCTERAMDGSNRCLKSWSRPELGNFKAVVVSDNKQAILMFESYERASVLVQLDEVAIECRGSGICLDSEVPTTDGYFGTYQYLFQNGDFVINDLNRGIQIRPAHTLASPRLN